VGVLTASLPVTDPLGSKLADGRDGDGELHRSLRGERGNGGLLEQSLYKSAMDLVGRDAEGMWEDASMSNSEEGTEAKREVSICFDASFVI
jgi:hypothetical protein